ncbi:MAG: sulfur carrier protein ThiS [Candidatus Omnitrophota bacterium]
MKLKVNGKEEVLVKTSVSVKEILELFKVEMPDMVSVQLNGEFVKRENFQTTSLKDGDEIDFLYFMGGGSN